MKTLSKIAILIGLIAFISSCNKESLPVPNSSPSQLQNSGTQRLSNGRDTGTTAPPAFKKGDETTGVGDIVGGGDDDRDGGGGAKEKPNKK